MIDRTIGTMAGLRVLSSILEALAALAMLYYRDISAALRINAALGLVGPMVLILVTSVGLYSAADQLSIGRIVMILGGIGLIIFATR